jgi:hypothetical protein
VEQSSVDGLENGDGQRALPGVPIHLLCADTRRQAMIDEFDMDGDGEISQEEFIAIMLDGE